MQPTQTVGINVPVGHIIVNSRWANSTISSELRGSIPVHVDNSPSAIDFHPSCNVGVVYISEADAVEGRAYKSRVARLRKANKVRGAVIVERTATSAQYFIDIQSFCVGNLGLDLIPVKNQSEAAAFLVQLVYAEGKLGSNPFKRSVASPPKDPAVLATIMACKGIGKTGAKALLEKFPSLESICKASVEDLKAVISKSSAAKLHTFLHGNT